MLLVCAPFPQSNGNANKNSQRKTKMHDAWRMLPKPTTESLYMPGQGMVNHPPCTNFPSLKLFTVLAARPTLSPPLWLMLMQYVVELHTGGRIFLKPNHLEDISNSTSTLTPARKTYPTYINIWLEKNGMFTTSWRRMIWEW